MVNVRTKGQVGEREAAALLGGILSREGGVRRNLDQVRESDADILEIDGLCIEVKRQETLNVNSWWRQVCKAADKTGNIPVLMYRQNRKKWRFCLPAYLLIVGMPGRLEMETEEFAFWLKHWVNEKG